MKPARTYFGLLLLTLLASAGRFAVWAQPATDPPRVTAVKSPVDTFRNLLVMTAEQRNQALATRPEATRLNVLGKLRDYEALTPEARELRLRATELRWWLLPLMRLTATNRATQLEAVPANLRELVAERLAIWNLFPPPLQQEWLDIEETARLGALTVGLRQKSLAELTPQRRAELEAGLARWRTLSEDERRQTGDRFDSFFTLPEREQKKVLNTFSETERRQMEQTLASFEKLPIEKRRICVRSIVKFANLNLAERQQFLKNAERWQQMPPAEREAWKHLVQSVPEWPPLPPGLRQNEYPPLPSELGTPGTQPTKGG